VEINGNNYFVYRYVKTDDALEVGPDAPATDLPRPRIRFSQDPGTTVGEARYYLQAYRDHPAVTSNRVQLLIPDTDGAHATIVVPALMKLIEGENHGNYMEAIDYIEFKLKPRLWGYMSKGAQGKRHRTTGRPY